VKNVCIERTSAPRDHDSDDHHNATPRRRRPRAFAFLRRAVGITERRRPSRRRSPAMDLSLAKSLSHMRRSESWRGFARGVGGVVRRVGSVKNLVGKSARSSTATPLDWYCVFGVQALSMVSILSTTYIFSTAVFMCKFWGARDDADASLRAGVVIAAKPAFSAISSYPWGIAGDKAGFRATMLLSAFATMLLTAALGCVRSFAWAVVVRAASGLFDGVMTNSRSCMAKIRCVLYTGPHTTPSAW
jgi:hypothetical protein